MNPLMLVIFVLGAWGAGWPRDPEDYWPKGCKACRLIIGGLAALLVNIWYPIDVGTGFIPLIIAFAAGHVGAGLVDGIGNRLMPAKR
jgi:hypothetical protein